MDKWEKGRVAELVQDTVRAMKAQLSDRRQELTDGEQCNRG